MGTTLSARVVINLKILIEMPMWCERERSVFAVKCHRNSPSLIFIFSPPLLSFALFRIDFAMGFCSASIAHLKIVGEHNRCESYGMPTHTHTRTLWYMLLLNGFAENLFDLSITMRVKTLARLAVILIEPARVQVNNANVNGSWRFPFNGCWLI